MKVTEALKSRLVELKVVAADANEDQIKAAVGLALMDGKLSNDELQELIGNKAAKGVLDLLTKMNERLDRLETIKESAAPLIAATPAATSVAEPPAAPPATPRRSASQFEKMFSGAGENGVDLDPKSPATSYDVKVKGAWEQYDSTKRAATFPQYLGTKSNPRPHPMAGRPITVYDDKSPRNLNELSDLEKAISGAWAKWLLSIAMKGQLPPNARLNDHDSQLIQYALHECNFGGLINAGWGDKVGEESPNSIAVRNRRLTEMERKALIDDGTSGGLEIAPIFFDDNVIMTPLLNGEVFPLVNVVNITRGRRIEGATMSNVIGSWGGGDASSISLFNTSAFVAAFDNNIYVFDGAIEIGLDFLSDSPINVVNAVTASYGQRLLKELDEVIIQGDGTTQPEGVINQSGVNTVSFGSTTATVTSYMQLLFAVTKEYKRGYAGNRIAFFGNETSYQRARNIQVGASDQRLVFEYDVESYTLLGHPYVIDDSLANTVIGFCNFGRYRMYRRLGLTITSTTEGSTLKRANEMLIVMRSRWGGALEDGNACGLTTNALA